MSDLSIKSFQIGLGKEKKIIVNFVYIAPTVIKKNDKNGDVEMVAVCVLG